MKYVIAEKTLADAHGFNVFNHRTNGNNILLNEKEIMSSTSLHGSTIHERVQAINGSVYESLQIKQLLKEGGWND